MAPPQYNASILFPQESGVIEALQNDLTLRASSSGDVIVGTSAALRPEVDLAQDLGRSFLRWNNLYTNLINGVPPGNLLPVDARSVSGNIIPDVDNIYVLGNDTNRFGGISVALLKVSGLNAQDNHAIAVSGHLMPGADQVYDIGEAFNQWASVNATSGLFDVATLGDVDTSTLNVSDIFSILGSATATFAGDAFFQGTMEIQTPNFRPDASGVRSVGDSARPFYDMWANSGVFHRLRSQHPGGKLIVEGGLLPNGEYTDCLGSDELPFQQVAFGSGLQMRSIAAPNTADSESLHSAHEIRCSGHFTPGTIDGGELAVGTAEFELGLPSREWASLNAVSGVFSDIVTTPTLSTAFINPQDGGSVDIVVGGGLNPLDDDTYNLGNVVDRWKELHAVSGTFGLRPSVNESGVALRNENYWQETFGGFDLGGAVTFQGFTPDNDGMNTNIYPMCIARRCRLHPQYSFSTAHANASPPGMWYTLIRKNGVDAASGVFSWSDSGGMSKTAEQWNQNVSFEPADHYTVVIHNNGSGVPITVTVARTTIGFIVDDPE